MGTTSRQPYVYAANLTCTEEFKPEVFYDNYIGKRKPVVLRDQCSMILGDPSRQLDVKQLLEAAGKQSHRLVEVNTVAASCGISAEPSFSPIQGSQMIEMPLKELCEKLETNSNPGFYMTTQTLSTDDEGRPAVTTWLTDCLLEGKLVPLRPALLGNLVPMNAGNLWMGRTASKSSSGMHHDFHDNLYCLIKGIKTIRLAPPASVHKHTMVGKLHTLHENGRIVYQEQLDGTASSIRPDGADSGVERILQLEVRKDEIELELSTLLHGNDDSRRKTMEAQLDDVEEELLDIEMENSGVDDDEGVRQDSDSVSSSSIERSAKRTKVEKATNGSVPPNFVSRESDDVRFETITLRAGDVLYLPAGWFHEVFSHGDEYHMAINYWCHPPDAKAPFDKPYESAFWQRDWDARGM